MLKIQMFDGFDTATITERVNKWIEKNNIEVVSTNTSISSYGNEGHYMHIVLTVLYKESAEAVKERVKAGYDAYMTGANEYMSR